MKKVSSAAKDKEKAHVFVTPKKCMRANMTFCVEPKSSRKEKLGTDRKTMEDSEEQLDTYLPLSILKSMFYLSSLENAKAENNEQKTFNFEYTKIQNEMNELCSLSEELNMLKKQENMYKQLAEKASCTFDTMLDNKDVSGKEENTENSFHNGQNKNGMLAGDMILEIEKLSNEFIVSVFENSQGNYNDQLKNECKEHVKLVNDLQRETEWCNSMLSIAEEISTTAYTVIE